MNNQTIRTKPNERDYCTRQELPGLLGVGQWTCDKLIKESNAGINIDGRKIVDVRIIKDHINSKRFKSEKSIELKELRCKKCNRMLGRSNGDAEIKCPKCSTLNVFNIEV